MQEWNAGSVLAHHSIASGADRQVGGDNCALRSSYLHYLEHEGLTWLFRLTTECRAHTAIQSVAGRVQPRIHCPPIRFGSCAARCAKERREKVCVFLSSAYTCSLNQRLRKSP